MGKNNNITAGLRFRTAILAACCLILAACASQPSATLSRIPADQIADETSKSGLFTQPLKYEKTAPNCRGDCPSLKVDSLIFPGVPILTELVDHALVVLTAIGSASPLPYTTLNEFEEHYWQTAGPRDETLLSAKAIYRNKSLTVLELNTWQYFTGAAHGIPATQYLIWDNEQEKVLGTNDIFQPGRYDDYVKILQQAHQQWAQKAIKESQLNANDFQRLWPFQPNDNLAFTDKGIVVKYNAYDIAPYYMGQPEILLDYQQLSSILKPEYLPN